MRYLIILLVVIFSPWTYVILSNPIPQIDQSLWQHSPEEIFLLNQRRSFYPFFGQLFQNKFTLSLNKFKGNLFYNLDPNLYFFATHPRERLGIKEFEKFPALFLPLFLIGFFLFLKKSSPKVIIFVFVTLFLSAFISPASFSGPIVMYPVIVYLISLGLRQAFKLWLKS